MKQLLLRGFDKELARRIRVLARREKVSLNKAALLLMRRGTGIAETAPESTIGDALDEFIGTWSVEDERRLIENIKVFETVDAELWK